MPKTFILATLLDITVIRHKFCFRYTVLKPDSLKTDNSVGAFSRRRLSKKLSLHQMRDWQLVLPVS